MAAQARPEASRPGRAPGDHGHLGVEPFDLAELASHRAGGDEVRGAGQQVDDRGRERPPPGRQPRHRPSRHEGGRQRRGHAGHAEGHGQHHRPGRQHPGGGGDAGGGDECRDGGRLEDTKVQVLDGVDVRDHAREELSASGSPQPGGCQRHQALVDGGAQVAQQPERRVVGDQALGVAKGRPGHTEEPHGDHRDGEHEHRWLLRRTGDQPGGGGGEADAREERGGSCCRRRDEASTGRPGGGEQPQQVAPATRCGHGDTRVSWRAASAGAGTSAMTRSASARRAGR